MLKSRKNAEENIPVIFAQSGRVAFQGGKNLATIQRSKTARDFGFSFNHTQVTFRLIVIKRNGWIREEAKVPQVKSYSPLR